MEGPYPQCEHKCRSEMCNSVNAETFRNLQSGSGTGPNGDTGSGKGTGNSLKMNVASVLTIVMLLCLYCCNF